MSICTVEALGVDCADGHLDAGQIGDVGADTFVLNACSSYEQGQRLVDNGAIAGVVTLKDVISSMATKIGRTIARLLNYGFPVGAATNLIQDTMFSGEHYGVVGDSNAKLAQTTGGSPEVLKIKQTDGNQFKFCIDTFASWNYDIGSMFTPHLDKVDRRYVVPGEFGPWTGNKNTLSKYLAHKQIPVIAEGDYYRSDEVSVSGLLNDLEADE